MAHGQGTGNDQSGRIGEAVPAYAAGLVRAWSLKSAELGWPGDVRWDVEATRTVAAACLTGAGLMDALRTLADQRLDEAATLADYERDIAALAACLEQHDGTFRPERLSALGKEAGRWVTARDHTIGQLVDPSSEFRTRTAFLADLTHPAFLRVDQPVWIARWSTGTTTWSSPAHRMAVAARLAPSLAAEESAAYLGPATLAVLLAAPGRGTDLERLLRGLPELRPLSVTMAHRPACDDVCELADWLVTTFPELVGEPLP
ncbi:hypothetical protein BAY59_25170 [Prauserella coralliicola]|nr:hypothetical protein BAY59_25170 [Prauserella coralliicola]